MEIYISILCSDSIYGYTYTILLVDLVGPQGRLSLGLDHKQA